MTKEELYQIIKEDIKKNTFIVDPNTFQPIRRITLDLKLEPIQDSNCFLTKEEIYQTIGQAICDCLTNG